MLFRISVQVYIISWGRREERRRGGRERSKGGYTIDEEKKILSFILNLYKYIFFEWKVTVHIQDNVEGSECPKHIVT